MLAQFEGGEIAEDDLPRDVLVELLRSRAEVPIEPDVLMKEIGFFLLAGAFTSIHTFTHAMHEIFCWRSDHPEDAARYREDPLFLQKPFMKACACIPPVQLQDDARFAPCNCLRAITRRRKTKSMSTCCLPIAIQRCLVLTRPSTARIGKSLAALVPTGCPSEPACMRASG